MLKTLENEDMGRGNFMKRITLLHTVKPGYIGFGAEVLAAFPDIQVTNILDEYLAQEAVECGASTHLANRFLAAAKLAESTDADLIVCTCTSMIPIIDSVRPFLNVPIILIDDELHRQAPFHGENVTILATAESALETTRKKYMESVEKQKAGNKTVSTFVCPEANRYMREGNMAEHDRLVLESVKDIKNTDLIILSQYSLTHLSTDIEAICGCEVMGSDRYCIQEIARILNEKIV